MFFQRSQLRTPFEWCHFPSFRWAFGGASGLSAGSYLFLLYINGLPRNISSDCRSFADDVLLYNIRENYKMLQKDFNKLEKWGNLGQLSFNNNNAQFYQYMTTLYNNHII